MTEADVVTTMLIAKSKAKSETNVVERERNSANLGKGIALSEVELKKVAVRR